MLMSFQRHPEFFPKTGSKCISFLAIWLSWNPENYTIATLFHIIWHAWTAETCTQLLVGYFSIKAYGNESPVSSISLTGTCQAYMGDTVWCQKVFRESISSKNFEFIILVLNRFIKQGATTNKMCLFLSWLSLTLSEQDAQLSKKQESCACVAMCCVFCSTWLNKRLTPVPLVLCRVFETAGCLSATKCCYESLTKLESLCSCA